MRRRAVVPHDAVLEASQPPAGSGPPHQALAVTAAAAYCLHALGAKSLQPPVGPFQFRLDSTPVPFL